MAASGGKAAQASAAPAAATALVKAGEVWAMPVTSPPIVINGVRVAHLALATLSFCVFEDILTKAEIARQRAKAKSTKKFYNREKIKAALRAYDEGGHLIPLTEMDVLNLPRAYASEITEVAGLAIEPQGEVLTDGDGIGTPILYKLGTPLKTATEEITELEFTARTLGDIEDVLAADTMPGQVLALVRNSARPIGPDINLQVLPSWAVDQLTITDGVLIGEKVLPRFLD